MAKSIKLVAKDVSIDNGVTYCSAGLALYDGEVELNAFFLQPENLTEALGGITEYGMLIFNSDNSDLSSSVTIACVEAGEEVTEANTTSVSVTLQDIINTEVGDAVNSSATPGE